MGSLAIRTRKARLQRRMMQSQLAALLKISRSAVGNWESPTGISPSSARLIAITLATEVSYEWLATGRGEPSLSLDWIPGTDAELVDDPTERRLLHAFRHARTSTRKMVWHLLEARSPSQV